jgi:ankyrin repeat protein
MILTLLIKAGANLNLQNNLGQTPIAIAVQKGEIDIVQQLIDAKVNVNLPNTQNYTPLHLAIA